MNKKLVISLIIILIGVGTLGFIIATYIDAGQKLGDLRIEVTYQSSQGPTIRIYNPTMYRYVINDLKIDCYAGSVKVATLCLEEPVQVPSHGSVEARLVVRNFSFWGTLIAYFDKGSQHYNYNIKATAYLGDLRLGTYEICRTSQYSSG